MIDCVKTVDTILFFICPCLPQRQGSPQKLQISLIFVSYIYITSFIVVITPPFKTFTPPNMYMFLTPPIRRCFFMRFYSFFVRFWVNYRVFWGGCLSFWGIIFFIIVHIKYFCSRQNYTAYNRQNLRVVQAKVHTNFKLLI